MKRVSMWTIIFAGSLLLLGTGCSQPTDSTTLQISDPRAPHQGLNIFRASEKEGVVEGAYVKGENFIAFVSTRGEKHTWLMRAWDPQAPLYDTQTCYTSQTGDPFIVEGNCPPAKIDLQIPTTSKQEIIPWTRTDDFRLAIQASDELKALPFPPGLIWNQRALVNSAANIRNEIPAQGEQPAQSYSM